MVGFAGTVFAGKKAKVDVCHNGSEYTGVIDPLPALYDPDAWEIRAFVININKNAETAHERNHGDLVGSDFSVGEEDVITEVSLIVDDVGNVVITGFETQPSCGEAITPVPE